MTRFIFIDESGNPQFYAKRKRPLWIEPDFVPVMFLGMIITEDRRALREKVTDFQQSVLKDPLLNSIYSVAQPGWYLHARADHSDINLKTVEFIRSLDGFEFHAVIGRKIPEVFIHKHNGNHNEFYFDMLHKLLELNGLDPGYKYNLYLSQRHSNTEQRFSEAIEKAMSAEKRKTKGIEYSNSIVRSKDFPEMSLVDYLLWALQRYILKGERRYFTALEKHYGKILDVYENDGQGKLYDNMDSFDLTKASPYIK